MSAMGRKRDASSKQPLPLHHLQQPPLHRCQHAGEVVAALEDLAVLREEIEALKEGSRREEVAGEPATRKRSAKR